MGTLEPFAVSFSGIHLVEASAGTGKTYNITSLYIRALIELDISISDVLVVTYTEAATKELKDRLLNRIRESIMVLRTGEVPDENDEFLSDLLCNVSDKKLAAQQLEQALRTFDEAAIHTIHGFCYQALQEQAFESGAMYDAEMIGDDTELVLEAVDDFWRNWVNEYTKDPLKRPLLQYLIDKNYSPDGLAKEIGSHLGQPFLEIHPQETFSTDDLKEELSALLRIYEEMQNCWCGEREQILSLLQADGLNGNKYRKNSLPGWMEEVDTFLRQNTPPIQLIDCFHKFSVSTLRESLNKGTTHPPEHPFFELAEEYYRIVESLKDFEAGFKKRLLFYLRGALREKKEDQQVLSYDDLLLRLQEALNMGRQGERLANKLREKYPLALVDEFQDTDPSQYDIFRRIYKSDTGNSALFMIGDPKQSIYSFRGADVFSYLKAKRDAPENNIHGLDRNFRSTPELIAGINTLFGCHPNPFILDKITFESVKPGKNQENYNQLKEKSEQKPSIRFRKLSDPDQQKPYKGNAAELAAEDTAKEIRRIIAGGKKGTITIGPDSVEAKDIAVLVRTHRQAAQIGEKLQDRGIKSVQYSEESVFESEEADQLQVFLKAVAEPANETLIKTALALPLTGYKAHQLLSLEEDDDDWVKVLDQFSRWHRKWQSQGFAAMFRSVLQEAAIPEHLIKYRNGERRLTNVLHLGELLQEESRQHKEGTRGLLKWLARKRDEENGKQEEEQLRLESDEDLVKIVTMHRSKGLEYPIVFCPFLWYGPQLSDNGEPLVYHDADDMETAFLDLNGSSDSHRDRKRWLSEREELAESLRLAYVAMTRAEQCCYLTWVNARKSEFSPLGYLFQDPGSVFDRIKTAISDKYRPSGGKKIEEGIQQLCDDFPELFEISTTSPLKRKGKQLDLMESEDRLSMENRVFQRSTPLETSYHVSSFSSLTSWMEDDPYRPDYDQFLTGVERAEKTADDELEDTIFTFPKGPEPGTCIHKIFEEVDFQDFHGGDEVIKDELMKYGIDTRWKPVVEQMLQTVISAQIHPQKEGLTLANIAAEDMNQEMEFYYSSSDITSQQLLTIIRDDFHSMSQLHGKAPAGFLKGFIDLTFCFEGKYYLLDYKTNYLGDSFEDYTPEVLKNEMQEASYDLQYHIYTIALHRFLKKNLRDYTYDKYFGGAFYLFLRGINTDGREGIFFDRPNYSVIEKLDEYILTGGKHE